ncbi:MAG: lysophospholipid acyltransferase family protein [Acidimicrobiales bacterium]
MSLTTTSNRPSTGPPSRRQLLEYKAARALAVGVSRLYLPGLVTGRENLPPTGAYLLAPVHRSYVDWLIVGRVTGKRRMRYIAKAEIWKSKLVGRILEALGVFPVNRSGADREALERCREVLAGGEPLVMFPEGTRRSGPVVSDLREGVAYLALRAGVPVVPVGIGGSERAMPRGSAIPRPRRVEVVIGKPIWPSTANMGLPGGAGPRAADGAGAEGAGDEGAGAAGAADEEDGAAGAADDGAGAASGDVAGAGSRKSGRVSRRATKEFSDELAAGIQGVFDEAQRRAGVKTKTA